VEFPCTGCGACCRVIGPLLGSDIGKTNPILDYAIKSFPYKTDAEGVCEKLVDNSCSVYEDRPLLCNVKALGILMKQDECEWFRFNAEACNRLIDRFNLDSSYKIQGF
jgi:Fe-S-cluster containining protein